MFTRPGKSWLMNVNYGLSNFMVLCLEIYGTLIQGPASPSNTHPGGARDRCLAARGTRDAAGLRPWDLFSFGVDDIRLVLTG